MLDLLPSGKGYFRSIPVSEGRKMGIFRNGDEINGLPVYKFLSREGIMLTYVQEEDTLFPEEENAIVPCRWRRH